MKPTINKVINKTVHTIVFPFDFEPNGITFSSKSKGKLYTQSFYTRFNKKRKHIADPNTSHIDTLLTIYQIYINNANKLCSSKNIT